MGAVLPGRAGSIIALRPNDFAYSKLKAASSNYSLEHLENLMLDFNAYDENSKTGKVDIILGLKQIILAM